MSTTEGRNGKLPPLVFVHGWKAAVLKDQTSGQEKFNYALSHVLGFGGDDLDLPMEWDTNGSQIRDNLIPSHPTRNVTCLCGLVTLLEIYGPLLRHLEKTRDLRLFVYDWRRELGETSHKLEAFLMEIVEKTGKKPQVIGHSMGCLITLHVLNRSPQIFHSVLFGAAALGPSIRLCKDFSLIGGVNRVGLNDAIFTPSQHLSSPAPWHFLPHQGDSDLWDPSNGAQFLSFDDKDNKKQSTELNLHVVQTWKRYQMGMYHPKSGVTVTPDKEAWLQSVLDRALRFRKELIPKFDASKYPRVACLNSAGFPTEKSFVMNATDSSIDYNSPIMGTGDGSVLLSNSLPPRGIPVVQTITNKLEHSQVLNDLKAVDQLLHVLLSEI